MSIQMPITDLDQLLTHLISGCRPQRDFKMGLEHEILLLTQDSQRANFYQHIQPLLQEFVDHEGWSPVTEGTNLIGLEKNGSTVSLEPGGQLELSCRPHDDIASIHREVLDYYGLLEKYLPKHGMTPLMKGYDPMTDLAQRPWMPKERYKIMKPYMYQQGTLGHEMMTGTATVQVNMDFSSEEDMVKKFRVAVAVQPLITALFANASHTIHGDSGYASYRRYIWDHTDPDRCGLPLFVFDQDMGFRRYMDYALDVPMYFIIRDGAYVNMAGDSFRRFLKEGHGPHRPQLGDWQDHLSTIFTEVRLKTFLEMRGADMNPMPKMMALPTIWMGLLYHEKTLDAVYEWIAPWSKSFIMDLSKRTMKEGKKGAPDLCQELLDYAHQGVSCLNLSSCEQGFLNLL